MNKNLVIIIVFGLFPMLMISNSSYAQEDNQKSIELLKYKFQKDKNFGKLIGQIQNMLEKDIAFVKVIATFFNENGEIIGSESTNIDTDIVFSKMKVPFEMHLLENDIDDVGSFDIAITWKGENSGFNAFEGLQ
ncbi:MAG: hypothetical protein ACPKPY_05330 [Nitrososphaeraceae archaeon]